MAISQISWHIGRKPMEGSWLFQLHDHPEAIPTLMAGLGRFISEHTDPNDYRGKLFIVEPHRIRIRS
jgi:hypothetical protein